MKKVFFISIFAAIFSIQLSAQTAVGARGLFGYDGNSYGGLEFSVQKPGQFEFDLGFIGQSWKATILKHYPFIDMRHFGLYGGGGIGLGYYDQFEESFGTLALNLGSYIMIGRLQTSLDWRPEWNFFNAPGDDLGFNLALSARWVFGKR